MPVATSTRPAPTTILVPIRSTIRGASGATTSMTQAIGQHPQAGLEGREAEHDLEVLGDEEHGAEQAKNVMVMAMLAAVKRRFSKNRTSSIG